MGRRIKVSLIATLTAAVLLISGCIDSGIPLAQTSKPKTGSDFAQSVENGYDSMDTAVVSFIDRDEKAITFYNYELEKYYTLYYSGGTRYADKYGTTIALSQIGIGDIVNLWFLKSTSHLVAMCEATEIFTEPDISDFEINTWAKTFTVGEDTYRVTSGTYVVSGDEHINLSELNPMDRVTLRGNGNTIESIVVENGHGYVSLTGAEYFVKGFIEIGSKIIYQIEDKMLSVVPEGEYTVRITGKGTEVIRDIKVSRNEETVIDLSDVEISKVTSKAVSIKVKPTKAEIWVDNKMIDRSYPVYCTLGMHKLVAIADGYKTLSKYFNVTEDTNEVSIVMIELPKEKDVTSNDVSGNNKKNTNGTGTSTSTSTSTSISTSTSTSTSTSSSTSTSTSTSGSTGTSGSTSTSGSTGTSGTGNSDKETIYYVTIPAPKGVEIYWDGNYRGLAPISFKKEPGTHVITLRKAGYETRSFTVTLDDSLEDVSFTFDDLVKKAEE